MPSSRQMSACGQGRKSRYFLRHGIAWMTNSAPSSEIRTTVPADARRCRSRAVVLGAVCRRRRAARSRVAIRQLGRRRVPRHRARGRLGGSSRRQLRQRGPDGLRPAHVILRGCRVEGVEFVGGQPYCHDLHGCGSTTRAPAHPTLEFVDVIADLGLVGPLLDLPLAHHPKIVLRKAGDGQSRPDDRPIRPSRSGGTGGQPRRPGPRPVCHCQHRGGEPPPPSHRLPPATPGAIRRVTWGVAGVASELASIDVKNDEEIQCARR